MYLGKWYDLVRVPIASIATPVPPKAFVRSHCLETQVTRCADVWRINESIRLLGYDQRDLKIMIAIVFMGKRMRVVMRERVVMVMMKVVVWWWWREWW